MAWGAILALGGLAAAGSALAWGRWRWRRQTIARRALMRAASVAPAVTRYDRRDLETLPSPVRRYFEAVLRDGQAIVTSVQFVQSGQFRINERQAGWQPFHATQWVTMHPPGFDWDARITVAPGLVVWVRDAYALGVGSLRAALLGLVTVADVHGNEASARGELMRYLAEAAWYPTALLPSQGVRWAAIDDVSAQATLSDGATTVTLTFTFGNDGLITTVWAASRPRSATESAPWLCRLSGWEQHAGMGVPTQGEVEWQLPSGPAPYFIGRMAQLRYTLATG